MKVPYISASRIELYDKCPRSYYYTYEMGLKRDTHPAAHVGSCVHKALEQYIGHGADLFKAYGEAYKASPLTQKQYYDDGLAILKNLEKRGIRDEGIVTLDVEKKFSLVLNNGVKILGYIDRIDRRDDKTLEITDYKSTKHPKTQDQIDTDVQVGLYTLAVREQLYPNYPIIIITFDFVRFNRVSTIRTPAQLMALEDYLKITKDKIEADDNPKGIVSYNCRWCNFKMICEAYKKKINDPISKIGELEKYSDEELAQILGENEFKLGELKSQVERLRDYFKTKLIDDEKLYIRGNDNYVVGMKTRRKKTVYNEDTIKELIKEKGLLIESVMSFDKEKIESVLNDAKSRDKLNETLKISYTKPMINVYRNKNNE